MLEEWEHGQENFMNILKKRKTIEDNAHVEEIEAYDILEIIMKKGKP